MDLYLMDQRGGAAKQLTADSRSNGYPRVTRDGRHVVFMSDRTGRPNIWRMDLDGGNQRRLTDGVDLYPDVSPDGRWVVYQSWAGSNALRRVSIDGGQFTQLTNYVSGTPAFSPDGRQIACSIQEEAGSTLIQVAVIDAEGGAPVKTFPLPGEGQTDSNALRWTADGREIVYAYTDKGVSNLWAQPADGGKPRQISNFTSDRIFWFDFSHDGRRIALSRGTQTGDGVLIKDFR